MITYTPQDYNVTIHRGFVREDGKILWGLNPKLKSGLEWRTPEAFRRNVKQKQAARKVRYHNHKNTIDDLKLEHGCEICGFGTHKYAKKWRKHVAMMLEFDHIDPATKLHNVCDMANYSWELIQAEIDKCRVICKVCHCIHTGNQNRKETSDE